MKKKSKHASLAQQNGFGPATSLHRILGWHKTQQSLALAVYWLAGFIGPGELQLVVSHLLESQFQSYG
jgi:hypothetical protein